MGLLSNKEIICLWTFSGERNRTSMNKLLTLDSISRWFSSSQLLSIVLSAVADLKFAMDGKYFVRCFDAVTVYVIGLRCLMFT